MNKQHIIRLSHIIKSKGITQVVVSPGSRNAPIIIIFKANMELQLLSVPDERSAGFFALGLAMQSGKPVALLSTSGTAVLNYAPAIAEAYYLKIPLLVMTADRPDYLIDQGDSQTIRQNKIYSNYIRKSFQLPSMINSDYDEWYIDRIVNEAVDRTMFPDAGPVHINIPLEEPLYNLETTVRLSEVRIINLAAVESRVTVQEITKLADQWNSASSKLIIAGQLPPDDKVASLLEDLSDDPSVTVLTECTSNLCNTRYVNNIDRALTQITPDRKNAFKPDLLLTIGGAVVSKKIKALLREMHPNIHWHVNADTDEFHFDTYRSLTTTLPVKTTDFLEQLLAHSLMGINKQARPQKVVTSNDIHLSSYLARWKHAGQTARMLHNQFITKLPFSDLKAYSSIFSVIPDGTHVHLANSTPVRYAQLFDQKPSVKFFSNRGTSGIDGCISTAAGYSFNHKGITVVITGDIGFLYDSNGIWNQNLNGKLKIILINNGGGNIFRIIDGPSSFDALETYIETTHNYNAEGIAANFNIVYNRVSEEKELMKHLPLFFDENKQGRPEILEIITSNKTSAKVMKDYFQFLEQNATANV